MGKCHRHFYQERCYVARKPRQLGHIFWARLSAPPTSIRLLLVYGAIGVGCQIPKSSKVLFQFFRPLISPDDRSSRIQSDCSFSGLSVKVQSPMHSFKSLTLTSLCLSRNYHPGDCASRGLSFTRNISPCPYNLRGPPT